MHFEKTFDDVSEGSTIDESPKYLISEAVYSAFVREFKDCSPIHVDEAYARALGFKGRVMHGAILNGFISHYVGVFFAGKNGFLLSTQLKYLLPNYLDDEIRIESTIKVKSESTRVLQLQLQCVNVTQELVTAIGVVQIKFVA